MKELIIATSNKNKVREYQGLLSNLNIRIKSLSDVFEEVPEIIEDGETFKENAIIKAEQISKILNKPVLADDSGFEVSALDNLPGVKSARFMGEETPYEIKNQAILDKLKGHQDRSARFIAAIAIAIPNHQTQVFEGIVEGEVSEEIMGVGGFGYDPIFLIPSLNKTYGMLTLQEKSQLSHRKLALDKAKDYLMQITSEENTNNVLETIYSRQSIRRYQVRAIENEKIEILKKAFYHSPSSINGQPVSVIMTTDNTIKDQISMLSSQQKHINQAPLFLTFCIDLNRTQKYMDLIETEFNQRGTLDSIITATFDAGLAMENVMIAARSIGLDTVPIGALRRNADAISELLKLPQGVFPICGLVVGYADEQVIRIQKDKIDTSITWHPEAYQEASIECLEAYDLAIRKHNQSMYNQDVPYTKALKSYYASPVNPNLEDQLIKQGLLKK